MPIKGITDRDVSFPEIGTIRKGAPKGDKQPGKDLTYFRAVFDERETVASNRFNDVYGDAPQELNILLPFNEFDRNFDALREVYVAGALIHRCDGEKVIYEIDPKTGKIIVVNGVPHTPCDGARCKPVGRLKVIIPELGRLAFMTVMTTSIHDVMSISKQLGALQAINGGRLAGIPLKLRRRPVKISTPSGEDGKRVRREKWLLSIEADPSWLEKMIGSMKIAALPGAVNGDLTKLIESPLGGEVVDSGDDDEIDVADTHISNEVNAAKSIGGLRKEFQELWNVAVNNGKHPKNTVKADASVDEWAAAIVGLKQLVEAVDEDGNVIDGEVKTHSETTLAINKHNGHKRPSDEMWARYSALADEAKSIGLSLPVIDELSITSDELAEVGKKLRKDVSEKAVGE